LRVSALDSKDMPRPRLLALLTGGLLASLATAPDPITHAQEAEPTDLVTPVEVEVVRLEVVVTEKGGRPRTNLRPEDFAVFEDGVKQEIVQFQAFARPGTETTPPPAPPAPGETAAVRPVTTGDELPARYIVLAIDDVHMEFDSLARVRKALDRFLDEDLKPEDQVALITTSGSSALSQEFTSDRQVLEDTLLRLSAKGRRAEWTGVPYITPYQAELIERGDPMALQVAVQEILAAGVFLDEDTAGGEAHRKARAILDEAVYDVRLTLEVLESLCRGLAGLSGRKTVFLVSDGFLTSLSSRASAGYDLRRIADAATRGGVVIYSLDTRGLVGPAPIFNASSRARTLPETSGLLQSISQLSIEAERDGMNALAVDTGGFLVEDQNDLRLGLREMLKDTETYYVLAYEPKNQKRDGKFRKIEVKLPGIDDVRIRTRSGYYARDDSRLRADSRSAKDDARREEQRRAEMRTALFALAPLTAIPVRVAADFVAAGGDQAEIVISGNVGVDTLPFVRLRDHLQATVETVAVIQDDQSKVVATLPTERSAMDLSDGDYRALLDHGLPYQKAVVLGPGRYQVRLACREDSTGQLGSAWQWIEVPDFSAGRLSLSSLFLLRENPDGATTAAQGSIPELESAQPLRLYHRDESLYVQLYAYNPARDSSGAASLSSQAQVLRDGVVLGTAAPEPMSGAEPGGAVPHLSRIRLRQFDPGDYELRITVTDRLANAVATRRATFTVE